MTSTVTIPTSITKIIQADLKPIAADVATIGGSVSGVLLLAEQIAPSLHVPAGAFAIIASASTVVGAIVAEARRIVGTKKAAAATAK